MALPKLTSSTAWDLIRADLVSALEGIDGTAIAESTVDVQSVAGQAVLKIASTTGFVTGRPVMIDAGETDEEAHSVLSIASGDSLTLDGDLANTHEVGVTVKQDWYNNDIDRVEIVESAEDLGPPVAGPWPMVNMFIGSEIPVEALTGYDEWIRTVFLAAWLPIQKERPVDEENESYYQMLQADFDKAIMADWTRGGHAINTRITESRRIVHDEIPPPEGEDRQGLPMVGLYLVVEVNYFKRRGDSY